MQIEARIMILEKSIIDLATQIIELQNSITANHVEVDEIIRKFTDDED